MEKQKRQFPFCVFFCNREHVQFPISSTKFLCFGVPVSIFGWLGATRHTRPLGREHVPHMRTLTRQVAAQGSCIAGVNPTVKLMHVNQINQGTKYNPETAQKVSREIIYPSLIAVKAKDWTQVIKLVSISNWLAVACILSEQILQYLSLQKRNYLLGFLHTRTTHGTRAPEAIDIVVETVPFLMQ